MRSHNLSFRLVCWHFARIAATQTNSSVWFNTTTQLPSSSVSQLRDEPEATAQSFQSFTGRSDTSSGAPASTSSIPSTNPLDKASKTLWSVSTFSGISTSTSALRAIGDYILEGIGSPTSPNSPDASDNTTAVDTVTSGAFIDVTVTPVVSTNQTATTSATGLFGSRNATSWLGTAQSWPTAFNVTAPPHTVSDTELPPGYATYGDSTSRIVCGVIDSACIATCQTSFSACSASWNSYNSNGGIITQTLTTYETQTITKYIARVPLNPVTLSTTYSIWRANTKGILTSTLSTVTTTLVFASDFIPETTLLSVDTSTFTDYAYTNTAMERPPCESTPFALMNSLCSVKTACIRSKCTVFANSLDMLYWSVATTFLNINGNSTRTELVSLEYNETTTQSAVYGDMTLTSPTIVHIMHVPEWLGTLSALISC